MFLSFYKNQLSKSRVNPTLFSQQKPHPTKVVPAKLKPNAYLSNPIKKPVQAKKKRQVTATIQKVNTIDSRGPLSNKYASKPESDKASSKLSPHRA